MYHLKRRKKRKDELARAVCDWTRRKLSLYKHIYPANQVNMTAAVLVTAQRKRLHSGIEQEVRKWKKVDCSSL